MLIMQKKQEVVFKQNVTFENSRKQLFLQNLQNLKISHQIRLPV